jgi:hypothetical protein
MGLTGVPLLLCCLTMVAILASWRLQNLSKLTLANRRLVVFRVGVILGAAGLLVIAACFIDPFPLTRHADGSLSISWLDRAWSLAGLLVITSTVFALFGEGKARIILVASEVFSLLLTFASVLQNGV